MSPLVEAEKRPVREGYLRWREEIRFWREYGEVYPYLEKSGPYRALKNTIWDLLEVKKGQVWMDAGCGPASMGRVVWEKSRGEVEKIIGVDIVLEPARRAIERGNGKPTIELLQANLEERLHFEGSFFDGIIGNLIFPYCVEFEGQRGKGALRGVLEEMFRLLKPGGQLIWSSPKQGVRFEWVFLASLPDIFNVIAYLRNPREELSRIFQGRAILKHALAIQERGKKGIYHFLGIEEVRDLLKEIGFIKSAFRKTFASQVWVIKSKKPG